MKHLRLFTILVLCASTLLLHAEPRRKKDKQPKVTAMTANVGITGLRTEGRENPLGLDVEQPRFSWQLEGSVNDIRQTGYRILVASHPDSLKNNRGDLWDSGDVSSDQCLWIPYGGRPLTANRYYYWKVCVATNHGITRWSRHAHWSAGLLGEGHWKGRWIGCDRAFSWDDESAHSRLSARYFRKTFAIGKPVKRATLHIAGLGLYEAFINGSRVGSQVLAPAPTDYRRSIIYNTYDVTDLLQSDDNCMAVTLGNGRFYTMRQHYKPYKITNFGYPKLRANLIIEFEDGRSQTIATDTSWKMTAGGPIRSSNEYDGEIYDATREPLMEGWTTIGYQDDFWMDAERVSIPDGTLMGNLTPSMEVVDSLRPQSLTPMLRLPDDDFDRGSGRTIIDFGQNFAGWMRIRVEGKGQKGDTIRLRFAERLTDGGELYTENLRDAEVTDYYICRGDDRGTWAPRFVTHGFRYAEVTNYPNAHAEDFIGEVVSDPMRNIGSFQCANDLLNRIVQNARWGIVSNYKGMPIDCPQRNERMPWLGDRTMGCLGESFLLDNAALYAKWLADIEQAQRSDGVIPDVAPAYWNYYSDNVSWPSVFIFGAEMLYRQFGDTAPVERHYPAMKKWLAHLEKDKMNKQGLITADKYGDWCVTPESPELIHSQDPDRKTDGPLIATAYYYRLLQTMCDFADLLSAQASPLRTEELQADRKHWQELRDRLRESFNRQYLHVNEGTSPAPRHLLYPDSIYYANNSVTSNLLPLAFGMVPPKYRDAVERQILKKILLKPADGHLCCGVIGIQWLMRELSRMGRTDVAYLLATNKTFPSWGYMVENGATAIWELWNGDTASPKMNSGNHVMLLGDLLPWCFENIGGIQAMAPAYKQIRLAPNFELQELPHADASYDSPYGRIVSRWKKTLHRLDWEIEIPANTTAQVVLPANARMGGLQIRSGNGGKTATSYNQPKTKTKKRKGKQAVGNEENHSVTLGSGKYSLSVVLDPAIASRSAVAHAADDSIRNDRNGILKDEFVYETAPFPSCHAATLAELPNGDLLCAFFGGTREAHPDVCIWTSRKRKLADGSMEEGWSTPVMVQDGVLNDTLRKACYNPVLYQVPGGELLLFFKIGRNVKDWTGYVIRSTDNGHTWSARERIQPAIASCIDKNGETMALPADSLLGAIKNKPEYIDGRILAPSSKEAGGWRCYMEISEDQGKSWRLVGPVPQDKNIRTIQPCLLRHKDGRLQMLCRTRNDKVGTAWSNDGGETWTKMELLDDLPNNNSGLDAVTMPDGTHAVVYNDFASVPGPDKPRRTPLCVATSKDGIRWQHVATLEESPIGQYSYPCMITGSDGTLHIAYTWRRERIKYIQLEIK